MVEPTPITDADLAELDCTITNCAMLGRPSLRLDIGEAASIVRRLRTAEARVIELETLINHPEIEDFTSGEILEAAHQQERWGAVHDAGKGPLDWFWLIGYLAQKAATAALAGDVDKAKHHTISTAAALRNWHGQLTGRTNAMRPGIDPVERKI